MGMEKIYVAFCENELGGIVDIKSFHDEEKARSYIKLKYIGEFNCAVDEGWGEFIDKEISPDYIRISYGETEYTWRVKESELE